jgi:hypothetical protein
MKNTATALITVIIIFMLTGISTSSYKEQTSTSQNDHSANFIAFTPYFDIKKNEFDWRALFVPFAVGFLWKTDKSQTTSFDLPYEFSRAYNTGKPINPQDYEKVKRYIESVLQQKLTSDIYGFQSQEAAFKNKFPDYFIVKPDAVIHSIHILGLASPEADAEGSEQPGTIDTKNIKLAGLRSSHAGKALEDVLSKLGVQHVRESTTYENNEIQFSESELHTLEDLASRNKTKSIFMLLKKYDDAVLTDKQTVQQLDMIVGAKRKVSISISMGDKKQNIVIIPLPILLLLALIILYCNRNKFHRVRNHELPGNDAQLSAQGASNSRRQKIDTSNAAAMNKPSDKSNDLIRLVKIEKDIEVYISDVIIDLNTNFFFYRHTLELYINKSLSDAHAAINSLARDMLMLWMDHDNTLRINASQQPEDQFTSVPQITYAVLHAIVLRRIIIDIQSTGNKKVPDTMDIADSAREELRKFREYL